MKITMHQILFVMTLLGATINGRRSFATTIHIDVQATAIGGDFLINGSPATSFAYETGRIYLRNPLTDDEVDLGLTNSGSFASTVVPGRYNIHYEHVLGGELVPRNGNAIIGNLNVPSPSEVMYMHDIDIPMTPLSGSILLNGNPPPTSQYHSGRIWAYDRRTQDEILLGATSDGVIDEIQLVPGRYDLLYERLIGGIVPQNERAFITEIQVSPFDRQFGPAWLSPVPEPSSTTMLASSAMFLFGFGRRFCQIIA